jgi:predicted ATPase
MLGMTNKQMLEILWEYDIDVKNHMSAIDENTKEKILKETSIDKTFVPDENHSSLRFVEIRGLFYKHDYRVAFDNVINILIAENGFGKTTILNIIIAVLKQDRNRLRKLPFRSLIIGLGETTIEITRDELNENNISKNEMKYMLMKVRDYLPESIYNNLFTRYIEYGNVDTEEIFYNIRKYANNIDTYHDFRRFIEIQKPSKLNRELDKKFKIIENLLKEELLYFTTYRRIEAELDNFLNISNDEKIRFKSKLDTSTINFGMEDVEIIVKELTDKLKQDAIKHYSIMNGQIIDDLLNNRVELSAREKGEIDTDKVKIVVGRIGQNRIQQLDKLMSFIENDSSVENKKFLEYYLFQLINIYENQKMIDEKIKKYRDVSNRYLVNKEIVYDEVMTEVKVIDKENGEKLSFSELSSGEKQILSLFAKLYLNTSKPAIFIIDEPELSLSIVWQRRLLEDIYDSGRIALLIATTHSPFIFKNKFRTFAKELKAYRIMGER